MFKIQKFDKNFLKKDIIEINFFDKLNYFNSKNYVKIQLKRNAKNEYHI